MIRCSRCKEKKATGALRLCAHCLRNNEIEYDTVGIHRAIRNVFGLPVEPPKGSKGINCRLCSNNCHMEPGMAGYCGLRKNENGVLVNIVPRGSALAKIYIDPLPTNCCASWFCPGSKKKGKNMAVFLFGCNFNCLYCQNDSHKLINIAPVVTEEEMIQSALKPKVKCVCFFGGSPEPQLPFTLRVARRIIKESNNHKHICWEWNGCGNPSLVKKASELSYISGGTIKFDLKCFHPNISYALCGVSNKQAFDNFRKIAMGSYKQVLHATTLLVPYYVDKEEVGQIARFISKIDPNIPYSLLIFHPDFYMKDLPITPRSQIDECYEIARSFLKCVNIGNKHLLPLAKN